MKTTAEIFDSISADSPPFLTALSKAQRIFKELDYSLAITHIPCDPETKMGQGLYADATKEERQAAEIAYMKGLLDIAQGRMKEGENYTPAEMQDDRPIERTAPPDCKDAIIANGDALKAMGDIKITGLNGVTPQPKLARGLHNIGQWKHSKDKELAKDIHAAKRNRELKKMINRITIERCACSHRAEQGGTAYDAKSAYLAYFCRKCNETRIARYDLADIRKACEGTTGRIHPFIRKEYTLAKGKMDLSKGRLEAFI